MTVSSSPATLRVLSFNIRGALFDDGLNRWPNRAGLNVRTILRHAPDLIGFQELHQGNLDVYRERLAGYDYRLGPPYNDDEPHYQYPAIFWNPKRVHVTESGGFWLSLTPERHSGSWDTACIRSAAWVRCVWLETGLAFALLNTHLDHVSELARVEGARLILQRLQPEIEAGTPIVTTGDFNCEPGSAAHRLFLEQGFVDAFAAAGWADPTPSFHAFRGREFEPGPGQAGRIDWILTRDGRQRFTIAACDLVDDAEPPLYPSDHYPALADLAIRSA